MSDIQSRPYNPKECCESCVFGNGKHAEWCFADVSDQDILDALYPMYRSHWEMAPGGLDAFQSYWEGMKKLRIASWRAPSDNAWILRKALNDLRLVSAEA